MKKLRFFFRLTAAFLNRFKGVILIGVLIGFVFFLLSQLVLPKIQFTQVEKIGISGRYQTDSLPENILSLIGEGLTKLDASEIPQPNIASSWETPDKGKTWIFTLKDNVFWQDGEKVTSKELVYEFSDVQIERPDNKTIIFKLQSPFAPFPAVVSHPTFKKGLLGTGEWKVDKISIISSYVQELDLVNKKGGKRIYKFYPTLERTKLALKLGEVNKVEDLVDSYPFDNWNTMKVSRTSDKTQVVTIFYNNQSTIFKDNKPLRQALAYAIDKRFLAEDKAVSPISPLSWAYNAQVKPYEYDPEKASQLLKDIPDDVKNTMEIKLVSSPILLNVAERVAKDWERVGIKTNVQVSSIVPSEYDAFLTILDLPQDPDQYSIWHSTETKTNYSKYNNQRIDKLLEDGRATLDLEERRKIYLDFQRFLMEDIPAIFLYYPNYYTIVKK